MMRLALAEIAHLTLGDFFAFSYVHSLASQRFLADNVILS